jgi:hypothetical protein
MSVPVLLPVCNDRGSPRFLMQRINHLFTVSRAISIYNHISGYMARRCRRIPPKLAGLRAMRPARVGGDAAKPAQAYPLVGIYPYSRIYSYIVKVAVYSSGSGGDSDMRAS